MFGSIIKKIIKAILCKIPLQNIILFESAPDLSDNTKPVFDELIRRGYNNKYKFVWVCYDTVKGDYPQINNVKYLETEKHKLKTILLNYCARVTISCNRFLGRERKGQHNYFLTHGVPFKNGSSYYNAPKWINHLIASSEYMLPILARQLKVDENIIEPLGFPRNDVLTSKMKNLKPIFGDYEKFIAWYPTVKTFKSGRRTGCIQPIQFIWNSDYAKEINDALVKNHTLLIIKPHFAQLTSEIKQTNVSNIKFIDDHFLEENNISSYEMISGCDALLTDYSSVYHDYLLCNKPIGLIWQDIEEYLKDPGLIEEYEFVCSGGVKIYSCAELCDFVNDVYEGKDILREQRIFLLPYIHCSKLPDNANRVTDYIIKTAPL